MQFRHLPILALASLITAQDNSTEGRNSTQSLNATLSGNDQLSNLTSFLSLAPRLMQALSNASNITILAPSNNAFAEFGSSAMGQAIANDTGMLAALLQYHVLNGTYLSSAITNRSAFCPTMLSNATYANVTGGQVVEAVKIGNETVFYSGLLQNSTVTKANVNFTGGVVHIIDRVLTFPVGVLDTANDLNLTSFRGAVNATDEVNNANARNVTIFAPDNEAFRNISSALTNLTSEELRSIVEYHIVDSVHYSPSLMNGTTLRSSANGTDLRIRMGENGTMFVNAAKIVVPNVLLANGVMHIIDNVLNPLNNSMSASESATAGAPAFSGSAVSGGEQPFTSGQPTPTTQINPSSEGPGPAETKAMSSSKSGAAMPLMTGGVEYAALFGAGAAAILGF